MPLNIYIMASTKVTINSNGSIKIEGDFEICDRSGQQYDLVPLRTFKKQTFLRRISQRQF